MKTITFHVVAVFAVVVMSARPGGRSVGESSIDKTHEGKRPCTRRKCLGFLGLHVVVLVDDDRETWHWEWLCLPLLFVVGEMGHPSTPESMLEVASSIMDLACWNQCTARWPAETGPSTTIP